MLELEDILDECEIKDFDSLSFDVHKIVRSSSICKEFSIERTEKVWAYHKNDKCLFSRIDLVFTNQAIHTYDKTIRYDILHRFIVSPTELDTVCLLFNRDGEIELSHKNIVNTLAENQEMDLVEFIRTIQMVVIDSDLEKKKQYDAVIEWFYKDASIDVKHEPYYLCTLDYLGRRDKRAVSIRYKSEFLDFDIKALEKIDLDEKAKEMTKTFLHDYEVFFKDPYSSIALQKVKTRLKNLNRISAYSEENDEFSRYYAALIRDAKAYYYAREYPYTDILSALDKFGDSFESEKQKKDYAKFCFMHRNGLMWKLFQSIKDRQKIKVISAMSRSDGIGLNILHYAIIAGNEEIVSECLKNYKRIIDYSENYATYSYNPFDYMLVAGFLGNRNLAEQINETIGSVGVLLRTKRSLERYIAIREGLHIIAQTYVNGMGSNLQEARSSDSKYDYVDQVNNEAIQHEKDELDEKLNNDTEFINKLHEDLEEVERQIQYERVIFYPNLCEKITLFSTESDPYISAIRNFYEKPDDLYKALNASENDIKIVWGNGFFYYNIKDVFEFDWEKYEHANYKKSAESKSDSADDGSKRANNEKRQQKCSRPYGNSWFSPDAHKDYQKLRVEYRELAKKYHPDNNTGFEDIFKEINSEREIIMESLR